MFFNVPEVRAFLFWNGSVFTLRNKRKRIGKDIAVKGSRFDYKKLGKINIEYERLIGNTKQLIKYVPLSGLEITAEEWLSKAVSLSGPNARYLYNVTLLERFPNVWICEKCGGIFDSRWHVHSQLDGSKKGYRMICCECLGHKSLSCLSTNRLFEEIKWIF